MTLVVKLEKKVESRMTRMTCKTIQQSQGDKTTKDLSTRRQFFLKRYFNLKIFLC